MTMLQITACGYVLGVVIVGCCYAGFFRAHDETPSETVFRAAFVGLIWPLLAAALLGFGLRF